MLKKCELINVWLVIFLQSDLTLKKLLFIFNWRLNYLIIVNFPYTNNKYIKNQLEDTRIVNYLFRGINFPSFNTLILSVVLGKVMFISP